MSFSETLRLNGFPRGLERRSIETLQVNVGKLCNQACHHCHVEAGPKRKEIMESRTVERILELVRGAARSGRPIRTVDLTGGAPELNPHFRTLVTGLRALGCEVIDRCNLTVLFEKGQETTAEFLRDQRVQVVASLPCYSMENVDHQRGNGVFAKSIRALKLLNGLGYGKVGSGLLLDLVYNPLVPDLPPAQTELEAEYKVELRAHFGIEFNRLFTITNMPIKRFLHELERTGKLVEYMQLLLESFNPAAARDVMCLSLVSVGWDGQLYDCDFNQMLEIPLSGRMRTVFEIESLDELSHSAIALGEHCYGCTAGSGSSCGGSLT